MMNRGVSQSSNSEEIKGRFRSPPPKEEVLRKMKRSLSEDESGSCMSTLWKKGQRPLTSIERARILERVPFESKKPCFKLLMQPTYVGFNTKQLFIPIDFAWRYIKNQGDVVLFVPNVGYWSVQFKTYPLNSRNRSARLCDRWQKFANDNNLEVGDVCIFELLDGVEVSFQVSIIRFDDNECVQWSQGDYATNASKSNGDVRIKIEID